MQTRRLTLLMVASFCAALVALAFVYVSVTQAREVFALNPYCAKPVDDMLFMMTERLHIAWLIWGVAGLLSWACAFVANRIASASTQWERTTIALLWLSSLALVGFALAFGGYQLACYNVA